MQTAATYRGKGKKGSLHGLPFLLRKTGANAGLNNISGLFYRIIGINPVPPFSCCILP